MVAVGQYGNAPTSCILLWHHSWSGVSRGLALHSCAGRMNGFVNEIRSDLFLLGLLVAGRCV